MIELKKKPGSENGQDCYGAELQKKSIHSNGAADPKPKNNHESDATYMKLLLRNRNFRLYLISFTVTHVGEWFTYIASIALAEELLGSAATASRTTISILVVVRLLPNVLLSPFGGILADGRDRRESIIFLDVIGAITPLLFFFAMYFESICLIYVVTFLQQCIAGLYQPCRMALIPLLVPEEAYMKKATTMAELSWSVFAAVGSSLGGLVLTAFGFRTCFILDSLTYLVSAYLMWLIGGTWNVATEDNTGVIESRWHRIHGMAIDGVKYTYNSFWGGLVLLKASGGICYGGADVLNVSYSEPNGVDKNSPARLGLLFACMGVGCTIGPLVADPFTNMKEPISMQKACIVALAFTALGCLGMGLFDPFWSICAFTVVRAGGSSTNWIYSSVILQKFSTDAMMGRVLAIDYALGLLAEALSAYMAGVLEDGFDMSVNKIAFTMAATGCILFCFWGVYHLCEGGAARKETGVTELEAPVENLPLVPQHI